MRKRTMVLVSLVFVILLGLTACGSAGLSADQEVDSPVDGEDIGQGPGENGQDDQQNSGSETSDGDAGEENTAVESPEDQPPADAADDGFVPMPPEREPIEILSSGGRLLEGYYYPAKVPNAPVVVLMHWAGGTMQDWLIIAPWLQNRLDEITLPEGDGWPFHDISWFPPMLEDASFAVVIFNFGDFGNSPSGGDRESWMWDAVGALNFAASLEGVDPDRITAIGASIGSDGAADACYLFNDAGELGTCIGALSLSPGNYLTKTFTYTEAASFIDAAGYPVWCLAAENDGSSPELCASVDGTHAQGFLFEGGDHGMELLTQDQVFIDPPLSADVDPMMVIQEFLEVTSGQPLNDFTIP